MGIDLFEKSLMERIEQEKEAERERMLRELKPEKKKRDMKAAYKSELSDFASKHSFSQNTQQMNESKHGHVDLDTSLTSNKKEQKLRNKNPSLFNPMVGHMPQNQQ